MNSVMSVMGAVILPVVIEVLFVAGSERNWYYQTGYAYDLLSIGISASAGFACLAYRWPKYAWAIGFLYFPTSLFALTGVGIGAACGIHGRCL
jgi:hypothetical protein